MTNLPNLCFFPELNASATLKFVYTPVHGVGEPYAERAFAAFKFQPFIAVDKQKDPDPDFSTVKYPNPEEGEKTFHCAIETATKTNADFIIANDPDADRFALAERDSTETGWRIFTGNELGTLLGKTFPYKERKKKNFSLKVGGDGLLGEIEIQQLM